MLSKLNRAKPVLKYVYQRRGRFSAIGTALVLSSILKRPHDRWHEFEEDFRMYDSLRKKQ